VSPRTLERQVWDAGTARSLPGVAKALQLYMGLISSCALERVRGEEILPRGTLLDRVDPDMPQPVFVGAHVEDWWLHGNAAAYVTARDAEGYPAAARYYPAHRWGITEQRDFRGDLIPGGVTYLLDGQEVPRENVIHVQRGTDDTFPYRGMGVVEQHLRTLNRAGLEEAAESANLLDRGTPAVAIITPNVEPDQTQLDAAADRWVERFAGTAAKPAFFPKDTQIIPLSWNPTDAQMVEARAMSTKDIAAIFNLDPYWLGAEGSSHTYRSPGPMFLVLSKLSLGPVMDVFEDVWSHAWTPRGTRVRFDRTSLLRDDLSTMAQAFTTGSAYFPDKNEVRRYMGFPSLPEDAFPKPPPMLPAVPAADTPDDTEDTPTEEPTDE
jgi:hypothetical protein